MPGTVRISAGSLGSGSIFSRKTADVHTHRLVVVELAVGTPDVLDELSAGEGLTGVLSQEYHLAETRWA